MTPLLKLLRACRDDAERERFATVAGTTVNYLYSLAGCHRSEPKVGLAVRIEAASRKFNRASRGRVPVVTVRELAEMCSVGQA